jgi:hypothetical protein
VFSLEDSLDVVPVTNHFEVFQNSFHILDEHRTERFFVFFFR